MLNYGKEKIIWGTFQDFTFSLIFKVRTVCMYIITVVSQASLERKRWRRERAGPGTWQLDDAYFHLSQHSRPVGNSTERHSLDMEGSGEHENKREDDPDNEE